MQIGVMDKNENLRTDPFHYSDVKEWKPDAPYLAELEKARECILLGRPTLTH
jgi:hypothetical protein